LSAAEFLLSSVLSKSELEWLEAYSDQNFNDQI
jgi:hypothetical protein